MFFSCFLGSAASSIGVWAVSACMRECMGSVPEVRLLLRVGLYLRACCACHHVYVFISTFSGFHRVSGMPLMFFLCELPVLGLLFRELLSVSLLMDTGGFLRKSVGLDSGSVGKALTCASMRLGVWISRTRVKAGWAWWPAILSPWEAETVFWEEAG